MEEEEDVICGRRNLSKIPWQSPDQKGCTTTLDALEQICIDRDPTMERENREDNVAERASLTADSERNGVSAETSSSALRGLRHVSAKICRKVQQGNTTYNDVAEEIYQQIKAEEEEDGGDKKCDDKNVRRRVYDALNVLMAVDVIAKDSNRGIIWKGIPDESKRICNKLTAERERRRRKIREKQEALQEQVMHHVSYRNLVLHNQRRERYLQPGIEKLPIPFITLNAHPYAIINCDASRELSHLQVDVNVPFAVHDDNSVLQHLGL